MGRTIWDWVASRWSHGWACWKRAKRHKVPGAVIIAVGLYGIYSTFSPALVIPEWARPEHWRKLPLPVAMVICLILIVIALVEGSYRINAEARAAIKPESALRRKAVLLAKELTALVNMYGEKPELPPEKNNAAGRITYGVNLHSWRGKIDASYRLQAKDRAISLSSELGALGEADSALESAANCTFVDEEKIELMVKRLREIAARLWSEEEFKQQ